RRILEKLRNETAAELKIARAGLARIAKEIYVNPMEALEKVDAAIKHQGKEDVVRRLEKNPGALGKIRGTMPMNMPNPLRPGDYVKSQEALKGFVGEIDRTANLETKLNDLEDALGGGPARGGRDGPSGRG